MTTSLPNDASEAGEHKLIRASRVEHVSVYSDGGERIGHIEDLAIDRVTGQVIYAIMSFGGFLGLGKRYHPLPWDVIHYDPSMSGYIVNLDRAALQDAPHFSAEDLEVFDGHEQRAHARSIYEYYGSIAPYVIPPL
jgi:sporulation protein YlmC with PRC-barrel domain